ncbi:ABC transporter permease [Streptococcus chenjunshii]|uniref:ABC transporter permease n=1 Tax=Streptococcus chenjunshii TaxID=2173853 RepID=A0A372KQ36_9STRE|nr:ABC transporter permease [Streptococcus chenjunshii]AXQ78694.1 ABC transporter permease [Streptococcus chenjunshii]RFU51713.1 ABC transporter permease [Streptococcus chenjunshii]RFU54034.1 ABC transporter permease [Streptococcus chenjunshii]
MFYIKLALNNLKQSFKQFAPFFLVSITTFVFSNITLLILVSPTAESMGSGAFALVLAYVVLAIFSAILCLYSYNFLLKQRYQEFGLYNILGMNKRQITWLSTLELTVIFFLTVVLGSLLSAVLSNVSYLVFVNLIQYDNLNFSITPVAFIINIFLFVAIFLFLEFVNVIRIRRTSGLNLFSNQNQGEREPRGNIFLAIIGLAAIGYGYYLSVTSGNLSALAGIVRFFQAIIAVIIGTYLFYISFITWYLKFRRKNKNYFYKPEHFVNTSQMIFRMKQNAVGLANITLLAIMAFVTIFSTVALYANNENLVKMQYPKNSLVEIHTVSNRQEAQTIMNEEVLPPLKEENSSFDKTFHQYLMTSFTIPYDRSKDTVSVNQEFLSQAITPGGLNNVGDLMVITQDDFRALGNDLPDLSEQQVAFYDYNQQNPYLFKTLDWFGSSYDNSYQIKEMKNMQEVSSAIPAGVLVVADDNQLEEMRTIYNQFTSYPSTYDYIAMTELNEKEQRILAEKAKENGGVLAIYEEEGEEDAAAAVFSVDSDLRNEVMKMTGGFLFTGFLLGIAFLLGAALIIYYKQLSEGTQDKQAYKILQEVGMSLKQVKRTINSQILLVFFLPLIISIIHFIFALPILKKLLLLFGVQGDQFIYTVSVLTIVSILLIYFLIYRLTSRTYYKIIER